MAKERTVKANPDLIDLVGFDKLPNEAHVNVRVTAAVLGCSIPTVWRWAAIGVLPKPRKIGPSCVRWPVGAIRQHLGIAT